MMMLKQCPHCYSKIDERAKRCPNCGQLVKAASGVYKAGTVLIAIGLLVFVGAALSGSAISIILSLAIAGIGALFRMLA